MVKSLVAKYGKELGMLIAGILGILVGQGILTEEKAYNIAGAIFAISGGAVAVAKYGRTIPLIAFMLLSPMAAIALAAPRVTPVQPQYKAVYVDELEGTVAADPPRQGFETDSLPTDYRLGKVNVAIGCVGGTAITVDTDDPLLSGKALTCVENDLSDDCYTTLSGSFARVRVYGSHFHVNCHLWVGAPVYNATPVVMHLTPERRGYDYFLLDGTTWKPYAIPTNCWGWGEIEFAAD